MKKMKKIKKERIGNGKKKTIHNRYYTYSLKKERVIIVIFFLFYS